MVTLIRGGGDLASGVAVRLHRAGLQVLITELPQPMVVRRLASFAEAVFRGQTEVEGIRARRATGLDEALAILRAGEIPVLVDPGAAVRVDLGGRWDRFAALALVDGRMTKRPPELGRASARLVIGLGPGFSAGENCHAVVETNRGHHLGRVIWQGPAEADTGVPELVASYSVERVLRAPAAGVLTAQAAIGDHLEPGQVVAAVGDSLVRAPFAGVLRGLLYPGLYVAAGAKIGDVDPRDDPRFVSQVSDKALAVGGGVLEAILACPELRPHLWE